MADWVQKRTQFIEKYGSQSDGDSKYRIFPWQHVVYEGRGFMEPVDYPVKGLYADPTKEITTYAEIDPDSQFVPGNAGTGGNVGILRG